MSVNFSLGLLLVFCMCVRQLTWEVYVGLELRVLVRGVAPLKDMFK